MNYIDPLYGKLSLTKLEVELFQTHPLTRLRDISLSAVPPQMLPWGQIASRFEHSVGVAHLAKIVSEKKEFKSISKELLAAALLHDVGSPPFSHLTEVFLKEKTNKSHELFAKDLLQDSSVLDILNKHHISFEKVLKLISGELNIFGPLIAGTIDLDNLDNTLRFGIGAGLIKRLFEPENLARSFAKDSSGLYLKSQASHDIDGWQFCRQQVYSSVYSQANLSAGSMLMRAIQIAFDLGDLTQEFFTLTDHQALYLLQHNCNPATKKLTHSAIHWQHYLLAAHTVTTKPSQKPKQFISDKSRWIKVADYLSHALDILPEEVAVHIDKDKGYRRINIPIKGEPIESLNPSFQQKYMVHVFIHPRHQKLLPIVKKLLNSLLT